MQSQRFGKARRVRRRAEFQRVFDSGVRIQTRYFTVVASSGAVTGDRLGIVASRKLGDAVRRNRAKRLIRELFRQIPPSSGRSGLDLVVIPRRELFDAAYSSLEADFRAALRRIGPRLSSHAR
jgi:ribonuclease P protein component